MKYQKKDPGRQSHCCLLLKSVMVFLKDWLVLGLCHILWNIVMPTFLFFSVIFKVDPDLKHKLSWTWWIAFSIHILKSKELSYSCFKFNIINSYLVFVLYFGQIDIVEFPLISEIQSSIPGCSPNTNWSGFMRTKNYLHLARPVLMATFEYRVG